MNALQGNLIVPITIVIVVLASIGLFFLILTRLSLVFQANSSKSDPDTAHIYWIYKSPFFIRLTDRMFVVSSILLFQYSKLVSCVVKRLNPSLKGKRILQVSCAFGNVSERIAESCARQGAEEYVLTDIMQSELDNAERKLKKFGDLCTYSKQDATNLDFEDQSFDYVVAFFLQFSKATVNMSKDVFDRIGLVRAVSADVAAAWLSIKLDVGNTGAVLTSSIVRRTTQPIGLGSPLSAESSRATSCR